MPTWTVDHHGGDAVHRIEPGDIVLGANYVYRCVEVRPVESRIWPDRWRIRVERLGPRDEHTRELVAAHLAGNRCHEVTTYERGERPDDRRCELPACVGCSHPDPA